jgi:hypothetical protein
MTVASQPSCEVLVDGTPYGATPLIDLAVPAGKHTIVLLNSAAGIKESYKVSLTTGQLWTRSFIWEGGKMSSSEKVSPKMLAGHVEPAVAPAPAAPTVVAVAAPVHEAPAAKPKPVEGPAAGGPVAAAAPAPKHEAPASAPPPVKPAAPAPPPGPPPPAPAARMVAGFVLEGQKLSDEQPHLPAFVMQTNRGRKLNGTYKYCVNKDGKVYEVTTVSSISGADAAIRDTMKSWTYKPQSGNVCATKVLTFQVP